MTKAKRVRSRKPTTTHQPRSSARTITYVGSFGNAPPWPAKPPMTATEIRKAAGITKAEFAFTMKLAKQLGFK